MSIEEIIATAGGIYRGRMNECGMDLILFDNPQTRTTLAMAAHEVTDVTVVKLHLTESNLKYALAEIAALKKQLAAGRREA